MADRDLVVGVLALQAGFVSPADVIAAAAAGPLDEKAESLATRLEAAGALTAQRRKEVDAMVDEAFALHAGDGRRTLESIGGRAAVARAFGDDAERVVPQERPGQYTRLGEIGRGGQSIVHC